MAEIIEVLNLQAIAAKLIEPGFRFGRGSPQPAGSTRDLLDGSNTDKELSAGKVEASAPTVMGGIVKK